MNVQRSFATIKWRFITSSAMVLSCEQRSGENFSALEASIVGVVRAQINFAPVALTGLQVSQDFPHKQLPWCRGHGCRS